MMYDDSSNSCTFQKSNFKVGGRTRFLGGASGIINRAKCGKMVIFLGLNQGIFQFVPETLGQPPLHLF